ncbi:MAG: hypothetical protein A3G97_03065 [Candidatus Rokubacteria bacterium RIFCSPLOWO2_12_FULL_69_21]|nr:MAG: hypothetical protein A3G97_03065 [Candidatus Rokubacteria bacterium RIFCSPLOWO2_12_FULL_69_21]
MNFSHLRTFMTVAKREGISKATEELALTQSAVSRQIQSLEESLGVELFVRRGRSLSMTEAGRILLEYGARTFQVLAEAREAIDGLRGLVRGHLRISAASTIGIYMLPETLGEFKALHAGIEISLSITNKEQVLRQLAAGTADLGFVGPPLRSPDLVQEEYVEDELVLIVSPHHRLARRATVPARELGEEVFVLREKGSGTREIMEEELRGAGLSLRHAMELGSTEAIKEAVAANLGVSVVSTHTIRQEVLLGRVCAVRIADLDLRRQIYLVHPRRTPLSPVAEAFRRFLLARGGPPAEGRGRALDARADPARRGGRATGRAARG